MHTKGTKTAPGPILAIYLLALPGYNLLTSIDAGEPNLNSKGIHGICIYASNDIQAAEISFSTSPSVEHLWITINLTGTDQLVAGCGCDFNMPQTDWVHKFSMTSDSHPSHKFLSMDQECLLFQHVMQPTRY